MKTKRIIVDVAIVVVFALLGWYCYDHGKTYDFIISNTAYVEAGENLESMEAVQVTVDSTAPKVLYADDRDQATAIGSGTHTARIDLLDLDDRPIPGESRNYSFTMESLGEKPSLNIPFAYKNGTPVK